MIQKIFPLVLLALIWTAGCQNNGPSTEDPSNSRASAADETILEEPVRSNATPAGPARWLGDIPVYEDFAALEPIFRKQTDTTYVINFWATWCKPCVEELPYFEKLHATYEREKVKVILVSLDFPRQLESKLLPFIEKHDLQPQVIALTDVRQNEWIDKVEPQWSGAIPVTIIYKANQRRFIGEQFAGYEELASIVKELL